MYKDLGLTLLLVLLLCHKGSTQADSTCPYRCHCFTPVQVLCDDEHMKSAPRNLSRQVKEVIIMTSAMEYLFPSTFGDSPQLNKLIFLNNALLSIHSQAFQHLTELQELEISGSPRLDHLYLGTFSKLSNLTTLLLNYNGVPTVLPGMFDPLKHLETLQIKGNSISDLHPFMFMNLHNLRVLDLSLNKLNHVRRQTFSGLVRLEILRINSNNLTDIPSDTFYIVCELIQLSLENNKIPALADGIFSTLTKLRVLNLRGNRLTTFSEKVFGFAATNLKELNLRGNRLTELSSLSGLTSLTDLILSSNELSNLSEDIFRNLKALENLDLSENQLTALPEKIFNDLLMIKTMYLHKNYLGQVDAKLFKDQEYINKLYLSDNQLKSLPPGLLDLFVFRVTLRLHGNPWQCDCHMWYLHDWALQNSQEIEMLDRVQCKSPGFLRKRSVASIDKDQLVCRVSKEEMPDLSSCSLQASRDTLTVKCRVDKCSPLTVKVQFLEDDGGMKEHVCKNQLPEHSQCSNETEMESDSL